MAKQGTNKRNRSFAGIESRRKSKPKPGLGRVHGASRLAQKQDPRPHQREGVIKQCPYKTTLKECSLNVGHHGGHRLVYQG